jgi:hypothetical protein
MEYFTQIPAVAYPYIQAVGSNNTVVLTNILSRSAFLREVVENSALFYEYQVKDAETPEIIADKLYGDPQRFWIVLLFNQLNNPYYDFPLVEEQLHDLIENKYSQSIEDAKTTIHHYEERIERTILFNDVVQSVDEKIYTISAQEQDENGVAVNRVGLPGTADTHIDGPSYTETFSNGVSVITSYSYWAISNWQYEVDENEKRRSIKLLDKNYVIAVENEFRRLMRDGN